MHSFIIKDTDVHTHQNHHLGITTMTVIWPNTMLIQMMVLRLKWNSPFFKIIVPVDRYVSSVAQHQKNNVSWGLWNWNYGRKDITALKAILLQSVSVPAVEFASYKQSPQPVGTRRVKRWMCAGSVGLIHLLWY